MPESLEDATAQLASTKAAHDWFGDEFLQVYLRFKRAEARAVADLAEEKIAARYADAY